MEFRIYVNNKLFNVCYNQVAYIVNVENSVKQFGNKKVTYKILREITNDKEKADWIDTLE